MELCYCVTQTVWRDVHKITPKTRTVVPAHCLQWPWDSESGCLEDLPGPTHLKKQVCGEPGGLPARPLPDVQLDRNVASVEGVRLRTQVPGIL